mgnify:CR=1 FL=1
MAKANNEPKKTNNEPKKVKITFDPKFSVAVEKTVLLREPETVVVGTSIRKNYKPIIEGLPTEFRIKKGEVKEVTIEQFKQLYELGLIDTPEDIAERQRKRNMVESTVRDNPHYNQMSGPLSKLYEDNFILVE